MKLLPLSLYCSWSIVIFLTAFSVKGQVAACHIDANVSDETVLTTLRQIKQLHTDLQQQLHDIDSVHHDQQYQFLTDIIVVLLEMYEQIVSATVTYYIVLHTSNHHSLHGSIARIIASGTVKIIGIVGRQIVYYVTHKDMTWKEKLCYCGAIIAIVIMIKLRIDQIPQSKPFPFYHQRPSIEQEQTGYVEGKFNNYK